MAVKERVDFTDRITGQTELGTDAPASVSFGGGVHLNAAVLRNTY